MQVKIDSTGDILDVVTTDKGSVEIRCDEQAVFEMSPHEADSLAEALRLVGHNNISRATVASAAGLSEAHGGAPK